MANLHDNLKTNMAAIVNKGYLINCDSFIRIIQSRSGTPCMMKSIVTVAFVLGSLEKRTEKHCRLD